MTQNKISMEYDVQVSPAKFHFERNAMNFKNGYDIRKINIIANDTKKYNLRDIPAYFTTKPFKSADIIDEHMVNRDPEVYKFIYKFVTEDDIEIIIEGYLTTDYNEHAWDITSLGIVRGE